MCLLRKRDAGQTARSTFGFFRRFQTRNRSQRAEIAAAVHRGPSPLSSVSTALFHLHALQAFALSAHRNASEREPSKPKDRVELANRQRLPDPTLDVHAAAIPAAGQSVIELDVGFRSACHFSTQEIRRYITEALWGISRRRTFFFCTSLEGHAYRNARPGPRSASEIEQRLITTSFISDKILRLRGSVPSNRSRY